MGAVRRWVATTAHLRSYTEGDDMSTRNLDVIVAMLIIGLGACWVAIRQAGR